MPSTTQEIIYYATDEKVILILILVSFSFLVIRKKWRAAIELAMASGLALVASSVIKKHRCYFTPSRCTF